MRKSPIFDDAQWGKSNIWWCIDAQWEKSNIWWYTMGKSKIFGDVEWGKAKYLVIHSGKSQMFGEKSNLHHSGRTLPAHQKEFLPAWKHIFRSASNKTKFFYVVKGLLLVIPVPKMSNYKHILPWSSQAAEPVTPAPPLLTQGTPCQVSQFKIQSRYTQPNIKV